MAGPTPATTTIAEGTEVGGHLDWIIVYDGDVRAWTAYIWNGAGTRYDLYTVTNLIAPDTWYRVELEVDQAVAGHVELWLNGTSVASVSGDTSVSAGYAQLTLLNEAGGTVYFDDVKVSNVQ